MMEQVSIRSLLFNLEYSLSGSFGIDFCQVHERVSFGIYVMIHLYLIMLLQIWI